MPYTNNTGEQFKMFVVCQKSKYGFCRYGKRCEKVPFTYICVLREDNKIKYIKFSLCGFQKEDTGFTDSSLCGQTYKEMEEHVKSDHKDAFDDEVFGWQGGFIKWNNWSI